jgi:hypothetical protein
MLLNSLARSKKTLPAALLLLTTGLLLLSCATGWQHTISPMLRLAPSQDDFTHGFCIGLAISFEAVALVLLLAHLQKQHKRQ